MSRIVSGNLRLALRPADLPAVVAAAADAVRPAAAAKGVRLDVPADGAAPRPSTATPTGSNRSSGTCWPTPSSSRPAGGTVAGVVAAGRRARGAGVTDTGQGIGPTSCRTCSTASARPTGPPAASTAGWGWGWRSSATWSSCTAARSRPRATGRAGGRRSACCLPGAAADRPAAPPAAAAARRPPPAVAWPACRWSWSTTSPTPGAGGPPLLRRDGARVTAVGSAADAVAAVAAVRPAVLVSDIGMPGGDGYGLIAAVRRLPPDAGGRTPAVALTAYARAEDRDRALAAGFHAHLPKPLDAAALLATVATLARAAQT